MPTFVHYSRPWLSAFLGSFVSVVCLLRLVGPSQAQQGFDLVIANGRVIDPESNLDAVRNIGISGGAIHAISAEQLAGRTTVDASGLVVSPGFIDLHQHARTQIIAETERIKAMDGVTTALELEVGTDDVDRWYGARQGKALINYGVSIGHIPVRMAVMGDVGDFLPSGPAAHRSASDAEIAKMKQGFERGLSRGAVAVGFGLAYTPEATRWEILELFRLAAHAGASAHVHMRGGERTAALMEVIAAATITGTQLHVVHIQSSGGPETDRLLSVIREARTRNIDVTTEMYPYTASATRIESALYDGWKEYTDSMFRDLLWPATGERLTRETFAKYRETGGTVIRFGNTEEVVEAAAADPLTMIASDGTTLKDGTGHPRTTGTYARILGHYVRERKALTLMTALRKMTLMPAQRLERRVPAMKNKGRIRVGADADLTVFDDQSVIDRATYQQPLTYSAGIRYVLVHGTLVVRDGRPEAVAPPGRPVRASIQ